LGGGEGSKQRALGKTGTAHEGPERRAWSPKLDPKADEYFQEKIWFMPWQKTACQEQTTKPPAERGEEKKGKR